MDANLGSATLVSRKLFDSFAAIARVCGVTREAARKWERIPPEHCHLFDESGKAFARPPQSATAMKIGANQEAPVIFAERAAARVTH